MNSKDRPEPLVAIVLAAGRGTRLYGPSGGSKALFRFGGKHLIDYVLTSIDAARIADVAIVVRDDDEELRAACGDYQQLVATGSGTLGAVIDAARYALERRADAVIASCDLVCDTDAVNNLLRGHYANPEWEAIFGVTALANDAAPIWVHTNEMGTIMDYGKGIIRSVRAFASVRVATAVFLRRMVDAVVKAQPDVITDTTLMRHLIVTKQVRAGAIDIGNAIDIDDRDDITLAAGIGRLILSTEA